MIPVMAACVLVTSGCASKAYMLAHQGSLAVGLAPYVFSDSVRPWLDRLGWSVDSAYQARAFENFVDGASASKYAREELLVLEVTFHWGSWQGLPRLGVVVERYSTEGGVRGERLPITDLAKNEAGLVMETLRRSIYRPGG